MINYFSYEYPQPSPGQSFSLNLDVVTCPWETTHRLVRIGIKGDQQVAVRTDTRVEIEFNPQRVASYRLIGYDRQENDAQGLKNENVGVHEVPAGYALTTFYEVVPSNRVWTAANTQMPGAAGEKSEPMLIAKLELDRTGKNAGLKIIQRTGTDTGSDFAAAPADLKFAAAVAEFGMIVRGSEYKGKASLEDVIEWARQGMGADATGSRADFIQLVRKTQTLKKS
jgi:Ca-activated chloride channel family protein